MAENEHDLRAELVKLLMSRVEADPYPSISMMDRLESLLVPEEMPRYTRMLMDKLDEETYPSITMLGRLTNLT